jgi:N4-gp56 family major capsid protein
MAIVMTSDGGLTVQMKTYYDRRLISRTLPNLLFAKFGQRRSIPRHGGKIIEFRRFATLGVAKTPLAEGVPPALQLITSTAITATVVQQGAAVGFSDIVSTTTFDPLLEEITDLLAEQASETIDEIIRDVLVAGTSVQYAGAATSRVTVAAASTLGVAEVRRAVLQLKLNRAKPIDGMYHAIIDPRTAHDLQGTAEWVTANNYAQSGRVFDGSLGTLYGVKFWVTDKVSVLANAGVGGTVDVYQSLFFGRDAFGIVGLDGHNLQTIHKALGSAGTADPLNQQGSMGWKVMFTTKILNEAFIIRVEHSTSTGANT